MTPSERKKIISDIVDEVESEVSFRVDDIVSNAVRDAVESAFEDMSEPETAVHLALAFMCQRDPDNEEFNRIDIDRQKMKDIITRASGYLKSIGSLNVLELERKIP